MKGGDRKKVHTNVMFFLENFRLLKAQARVYETLKQADKAASIWIITEAIENALDVLTDDERVCICLIYMESKGISDVAREIFRSETTVYRIRNNAIKKLNDVLYLPLVQSAEGDLENATRRDVLG